MMFPAVQETLDALQKLGHLVGCSPALFQVSGIKDKRAVTTQEVSVKGVSAERYGVRGYVGLSQRVE